MPEPHAAWPTEHRPVLFVVLGITVVLFVLGGFQVLKSIREPFAAPTGAYTSKDEEAAREVAAQKARDTDTDGLSDYDELSIYFTSPYLDDTDSDDVRDGDEVAAGEDPNCPVGKSCGSPETQIGPGPNPDDLATVPGTVAASTASQSQFVGLTPEVLENITPSQVRDLLRGSGVSEEVLARFGDADLMRLFEQTLATSNPLAATSTAP